MSESDRSAGGPVAWAPLTDLVPDLLTTLTGGERRRVLDAYAKIQQDPERFKSVLNEAEPLHLRYAQLAFSVAWWAAAKRFLVPPAVAGAIALGCGQEIGIRAVLVGVLLWVFVGIGWIRFTRRLRAYQAYFVPRLGSWKG